jgi:hypothetical protein
MVRLIDGSIPEVRIKYPHMMPEDTAIWTAFLEGGKYIPDKVWYDVKVGQPMPMPGGEPPWMKKYVSYSTRKRIDVVARVGLDHWVIECKPNAGHAALGQVIHYARAFMREYEYPGEVVPVIITDSMDPDLKIDYQEIGIVVIESQL